MVVVGAVRRGAGVVNSKPYAANAHQSAMLDAYIAHFESGDINLHKDSQRHWIKDVGPAVETNIGFIESYRCVPPPPPPPPPPPLPLAVTEAVDRRTNVARCDVLLCDVLVVVVQ